MFKKMKSWLYSQKYFLKTKKAASIETAFSNFSK